MGCGRSGLRGLLGLERTREVSNVKTSCGRGCRTSALFAGRGLAAVAGGLLRGGIVSEVVVVMEDDSSNFCYFSYRG